MKPSLSHDGASTADEARKDPGREFPDWEAYRNERPEALALRLSAMPRAEAAYIIRQVEGWQRLSRKVPAWAETPGIVYPVRLSLEQCSGQEAALYKRGVVERLLPDGRDRMIDLTGGLGVDFSFLAPLFKESVYVERNAELCALARHNLPALGLARATVVEGDAQHYLDSEARKADLIFLDPARRDNVGRKTVRIADCTPDVCQLAPRLLALARCVVIKLSPMLDIADALASLPQTTEVHVVATGGECKELLLVLDGRADARASAPLIYIKEGERQFCFSPEEERAATAPTARALSAYLFEPGSATLKAGAFKTVALRYGLEKLHPQSHLYTAARPVPEFPGRTFRILEAFGFAKHDLQTLRSRYAQANLTLRNFPSTTDALRKKLRLREGGDRYIFATTLADGSHTLIVCEKN